MYLNSDVITINVDISQMFEVELYFVAKLMSHFGNVHKHSALLSYHKQVHLCHVEGGRRGG